MSEPITNYTAANHTITYTAIIAAVATTSIHKHNYTSALNNDTYVTTSTISTAAVPHFDIAAAVSPIEHFSSGL